MPLRRLADRLLEAARLPTATVVGKVVDSFLVPVLLAVLFVLLQRPLGPRHLGGTVALLWFGTARLMLVHGLPASWPFRQKLVLVLAPVVVGALVLR